MVALAERVKGLEEVLYFEERGGVVLAFFDGDCHGFCEGGQFFEGEDEG